MASHWFLFLNGFSRARKLEKNGITFAGSGRNCWLVEESRLCEQGVDEIGRWESSMATACRLRGVLTSDTVGFDNEWGIGSRSSRFRTSSRGIS